MFRESIRKGQYRTETGVATNNNNNKYNNSDRNNNKRNSNHNVQI
jgi:hypothetical protein